MNASIDRRHDPNSRIPLALCLAVVTPLGFWSKVYRGPGHHWFNDYGGGVLYEVFWILLIALIWPRLAAWKIALGVFLATCALECLQLWRPPFLQAMRVTFVGRALIGTTFVGWDFPHYAAGCLAGWGWVGWLVRMSARAGARRRAAPHPVGQEQEEVGARRRRSKRPERHPDG